VFSGPKLPITIYGSAMVQTPDGTGVVLIGGSHPRKGLYELKCSSSSCEWILMDKELSINRLLNIAFYVPDTFAVTTPTPSTSPSPPTATTVTTPTATATTTPTTTAMTTTTDTIISSKYISQSILVRSSSTQLHTWQQVNF
jgi:hypothetical protein